MASNSMELLNREDSGVDHIASKETERDGASLPLGISEVQPQEYLQTCLGPKEIQAQTRVDEVSEEELEYSLAFRKELIGRKQTVPIQSWSKSKISFVSAIRKIMKTLSTRVDLGQYLMTGIRSGRPTPSGVKITKVRVPRRTDWNIPSAHPEEDSSANVPSTLNAEWVVPKTNASSQSITPQPRVLLFVHGGGYVIGSRRVVRNMTGQMAKEGAGELAVFSINYRLAPKHAFPAAIEDVLSAYSYLLNPPGNADFPGYSPDQITFAGNSAGGGVAMAAMFYCKETGRLPVPSGVVGLSPWYDLTQSSPAWWLNKTFDYIPAGTPDPKYINQDRYHCYLKSNKDIENPYASPIFFTEKSNPGPLCPMLIQVGGAERVRDDGIIFSQRNFPNASIQLEVYRDEPHDFGVFCGLGEPGGMGDFALQRVVEFVKKVSGTDAASEEPPARASYAITAVGSVQPLHYPLGIVEDGAACLVNAGVWHEDMELTWLNTVKDQLRAKGKDGIEMLHEYLEQLVNVNVIVKG